jgi:hypothetical protein
MNTKRNAFHAIWRPVAALALAIGLAAPALLAGDAVAQDAVVSAVDAAPADTAIYYELDLDVEGAQWQQAEALMARAGLPDALDLWRDEILKEGAEAGDFSVADLDALLGGEMAIVISPLAVERMASMMMAMEEMHGGDEVMDATPVVHAMEGPQGIAAVLLPGDPDAAWDYATRQINALAVERDIKVHEETHGGGEVIWTESAAKEVREAMAEDDPLETMFGHHGRGAFAAGMAGDFIIAAKDPADVTAIIDVIEGNSESLADSGAADEISSVVPEEVLSFGYVDVQLLVDALGDEAIASMESMMPADMPREAWGGQAAFAVSADQDGFRLDAVAQPAEGVDVSTFLVDNDPAVMTAAERTSADSFVFQAGKLAANSMAGAALGFSQMINAVESGEDWGAQEQTNPFPSPEEIEAEISAATSALEFDPQTDLFDLLGDEFIMFSSFPSFTMDGFGLDAVAAIDTSDPATLAVTARKFAAWIDRTAPDAATSVRKVGEDTLYVLSDPEGEVPVAVEFGVIDDQLVVGTESGIEALGSEPTSSLAADEQFQTVMGALPAEYNQVTYVNIAQAVTAYTAIMGEFDPGIADADVACAEFTDQAQAQTALDEDPVANSDLDLDFDGQACEGAFGGVASPVVVEGGIENIKAFAMVSYRDGDMAGTSAILYIAEQGS